MTKKCIAPVSYTGPCVGQKLFEDFNELDKAFYGWRRSLARAAVLDIQSLCKRLHAASLGHAERQVRTCWLQPVSAAQASSTWTAQWITPVRVLTGGS